MIPAEKPHAAYHRAVDTDRPACGALLSWRLTIGITILIVILSGMAA